MKWLRALGSLAVLLGLLFGVPWALLALADPAVLLGVDWPTALSRPDDGRILLGVLSMIAWLAWLVLAATILAELVAVLTLRRIDFPVPGTGWLRPLIGSLVAAATLAPGALATAGPAPVAAATSPAIPQAGPNTTEERRVPTGRTYVVQPGDELWSLAESQLGSGDRWRDLLTVNPHLSPDSRLAAGDRIQLPPDVVVVEGDSLWGLAARHLGDPQRWPEIHALNADLITEPDHLAVGWRLLLPTTEQPSGPVVRSAAPDPHPDPEPTPTVAPPPAPQADAPVPESLPARPSTPSAVIPVAVPEAAAVEAATDADRVLGPIGGILASTILVSVAARRRLQLVGRAVGRRLIPLAPETGRFWTALARRADTADPDSAPCHPATVILGWQDDGTDVLHDLESARWTSIVGAGDAQAVIGAMLTTLACAPWASDVEVVVVGADQRWAEALDDARIAEVDTVAEGVLRYLKLSARRRLELGMGTLEEARNDPDRAPAYRPVVYLLAAPATNSQHAQIEEALSFGDVGVSIVTLDGEGAQVRYDGERARLADTEFTPQLIEAPARRALIDLFRDSGTTDTEPAPWWSTQTGSEGARFMEVERTVGAPYVVLLGEPDILDPAGDPPSRARQQCVEYCAWLLLNPSSTSSKMQRSLLVAESTRRSNLSRLRRWLGADPHGIEYLPDAYNGRLKLDDRLTSDWQVLLGLVADGVDLASDSALRRALSMIDGVPLGSAADRWPWARALHDDMVSLIVDIACVFVDRCLLQGHVDEALWALGQAERAAPGHDEIAIRLVGAHSIGGNPEEADAAASEFLRQVLADNREVSAAHSRELALARRRRETPTPQHAI